MKCRESLSTPRSAFRLCKRFAIIGGLSGVLISLCFGGWLIYSVWSQPKPPSGQAVCGMPVLAGLFSIVFGCPVGAFVVAGIGGLLGSICDLIAWHRWRPLGREDGQMADDEGR